MLKNFKYIMFVLIVFCAFSLNVNAKKPALQGNCMYVFEGSMNGVKGTLSIKITQNEKNKINYFYYEGEALTDPNDSKWKDEGSGLFGYHLDKDKNGSFWNKDHFSSCPKYAFYKSSLTGINIYFSDNESEDGYVAKANVASTSTIGLSSDDLEKVEEIMDELKMIKGESSVDINSCEDLLGDDLVKVLNNIVTLGRIIIPILLNVFGVIDFGGAIFAGEEDKMQKAQKKFITRLIIGVVIFLIPSLLKIILTIAHSIWPVIDKSLCGILG